MNPIKLFSLSLVLSSIFNTALVHADATFEDSSDPLSLSLGLETEGSRTCKLRCSLIGPSPKFKSLGCFAGEFCEANHRILGVVRSGDPCIAGSELEGECFPLD